MVDGFITAFEKGDEILLKPNFDVGSPPPASSDPDLIITDGREYFINSRPACVETREPSMMLASDDMVTIDVEGVKTSESFEGNNLAEDP